MLVNLRSRMPGVCDLKLFKILKQFGCYDLILAAILFSMLSNLANFADDPGLGWHLKNGEYIASNNELSYFDPFLSSVTPRRWINDQWLSDLIFFHIYKSFSWAVLYSFVIVIFIFTFVFFNYLQTSKILKNYLVTLLALLLCLKLAEIHFILRPVVFSFLFFSLMYFKNLSILRLKEIKIFDYIFFFLIFCLWANMHPSFFLGIFQVIILSVMSFRLISLKKLISLSCASITATLINPHFTDLHASILELGSSAYFMKLNSEWLPVDLLSFEGRIFIFVNIIVFAGMLVTIRNKASRIDSRTSLFVFLLFIVFSLLSLRSRRFLPYLSICAFLPLSQAVLGLANLKFFDAFKIIGSFFKKLSKIENLSSHGKITGLAFFLVFMFTALLREQILFFRGGMGPSRITYPYQAVEFLNRTFENETNGEATAVFSVPDWGGFLTLSLPANARPVIDDRNTLLGENFYSRYFEAAKSPEGILSFNASYIILPKQLAVNKMLAESKQFESLYTDSQASIYKKRA